MQVSWARRDVRLAVYAWSAFAIVVSGTLLIRNLLVPDPLEKLRIVDHHDDTTVYVGSWMFPRGGPYVLGFESPHGQARLFINGELLCEPGARKCAQGIGSQLLRKVFAPGVVEVRFEAGPAARLLWHPPGRRGPPEYVPPSSLSPDEPNAATFSRWAGASPADGLASLLLALALLTLVAFLSRRSLAKIDRETWLAFAAVLAVGILVRLIGQGDAGQTWDEDVNWSAGRNYISNILSLDFAQRSWVWNMQHPPVMKYLVGIGAQFSDGYGPARAVSAVVMACACAICVLVGARLFSLRVGLLAGMFATLSPHLIAHGKIVGHEAPTTLWWSLGFYLTLLAHGYGTPEAEWQRRLVRVCAAVGVVLGLALMSRFANALLAPLLGLCIVVLAPRGLRVRAALVGGAVISLTCVLTAFVLWPRLWVEPIAHLREAWAVLRQSHSAEPFLGTVTNSPPRYYFVLYLLATAPLGLVIATAGGLVRLAIERKQQSLVLVLWLALPLAIALSPVRQDGVRYIVPSLAALATIAAVGVDWAVFARPTRAAVGWIVGALCCAYLVICGARIHPYYLDYYGEHFGGPKAVVEAKRFEVAWWGEGVAPAVDYVNRHAADNDRVYKRCVEPSHLTWLRADLWPEAPRATSAQWIIVYQAGWRPCDIPGDFKQVFEVRAQGAPLARVYRRN